MSKVYNLFISHSWNYSDAYEKVTGMIDNRPYFAYKNHSVPKDSPIHNAPNDALLYDAIKRQMNGCHVVIIMNSPYSTYSKWINKEIAIAKREFATPKPILAINPWGSKNTSSVVNVNADLIVNWNTESIIAGIRQLGG